MYNIALIENGIVENVIVGSMAFAETLGYEYVVDITEQRVGIGYSYFNGVFTAPIKLDPEPAAIPTTIHAAEIRRRFTFAEKTAIQTDTTPGTIVARDDLMSMTLLGQMIDPADADVQAAFDHLISVGHITAERKEEILEL